MGGLVREAVLRASALEAPPPYRIKTMPVYVEGKTVRGYKLEQFVDAFAMH